MVFGAIPMFFVVFFSILTFIINLTVSYDTLKSTVNANEMETHDLESQLENGQITQNASIKQLLQAHADEESQLTQMESQVNRIYNYIIPIK
jgi:predicted PurR-regulated permease PerM